MRHLGRQQRLRNHGLDEQEGAVGPIGSRQTTASVGGHTWDIHRGANGANAVFSFVRTTNTNAASVDLRALLTWLRTHSWMPDATVSEVQFGYEITSSAGGLEFTIHSYSVTSS